MLNKNRIEFILFISFARFLKAIGLQNTRRLGKILGAFIFIFVPIRKSTVLNNLSIAFPEKTTKEIKSICKKNYQNITITFFELMLLPHLSLENIKDHVHFDNFDLIEKYIKQNKGLILLTGHFGNWELIVLSSAANIKANFNVLAKPLRNSLLNKWVVDTRAKDNIKVIAPGVSVKSLYQSLKKGEVVGIAGDQRGPYEGHRYMFFNHPTSFNAGFAALALKNNCPIVLVFFERQEDFRYRCYVEELNAENLPDDKDKSLIELTQRYITRLEQMVRKTPEQYFWMHKLWKY